MSGLPRRASARAHPGDPVREGERLRAFGGREPRRYEDEHVDEEREHECDVPRDEFGLRETLSRASPTDDKDADHEREVEEPRRVCLDGDNEVERVSRGCSQVRTVENMFDSQGRTRADDHNRGQDELQQHRRRRRAEGPGAREEFAEGEDSLPRDLAEYARLPDRHSDKVSQRRQSDKDGEDALAGVGAEDGGKELPCEQLSRQLCLVYGHCSNICDWAALSMRDHVLGRLSLFAKKYNKKTMPRAVGPAVLSVRTGFLISLATLLAM